MCAGAARGTVPGQSWEDQQRMWAGGSERSTQDYDRGTSTTAYTDAQYLGGGASRDTGVTAYTDARYMGGRDTRGTAYTDGAFLGRGTGYSDSGYNGRDSKSDASIAGGDVMAQGTSRYTGADVRGTVYDGRLTDGDRMTQASRYTAAQSDSRYTDSTARHKQGSVRDTDASGDSFLDGRLTDGDRMTQGTRYTSADGRGTVLDGRLTDGDRMTQASRYTAADGRGTVHTDGRLTDGDRLTQALRYTAADNRYSVSDGRLTDGDRLTQASTLGGESLYAGSRAGTGRYMENREHSVLSADARSSDYYGAPRYLRSFHIMACPLPIPSSLSPP